MQIWFEESGKKIDIGVHEEGGIHDMLGMYQYEYFVNSRHTALWYKFDKTHGLYWLDGRQANKCYKKMVKCIENLSEKRTEDEEHPDEGNTKDVLMKILEWATKYPEAIIKVK